MAPTSEALSGSSRTADLDLTGRAIEAADGGEPLGAVKFRALAGSGWRAVRQGDPVRGAGRLTREAARIARGRSEIAPERGDWRFNDPTWKDNPVYRRLMQVYLAWAQEVRGRRGEGADLGWRDAGARALPLDVADVRRSRRRTALGNPAALKRAFETGGREPGARAATSVGDVRHNGGMPAAGRRRARHLGEDLAATPGSVVYRDEVREVIQYTPATPNVRTRPVVMVAPQINKYYFMDLAPGRSFVEHAGAAGASPTSRSPGATPARTSREWDLDTYAAGVVARSTSCATSLGSEDLIPAGAVRGGITTSHGALPPRLDRCDSG